MKKIFVLVLGMSLVACSKPHHSSQSSSGNQTTALSSGESSVTPIDAAASGGAGGTGDGGSSGGSASGAPKSEAPAQTAAASSGKSSSSNGGKTSLYWMMGTFAVIGGVILASDAITGGQAIGLFGKKKSPSSTESSQTVVPAQAEPKSDECALPLSAAEPSSTIQGAQEVVKFAETPNHSQ